MMQSKDTLFLRPEPEKKPPAPRGRTAGALLLFAAIVCIAAVLFGAAAAVRFFYRLSRDLPTVSQMQNIEPPLASKVLDKNGQLAYEFSIERRTWVPLEKIPSDLRNAVVAIEDRRFYKHWGIDLRRIVQAAVIDIFRRGYAQGASTITQQLARNLYLTARQSMVRKVREAMTAAQLESFYTKQEILELYLNQVYLGGGAWGMEAASEQYFSKHVRDLYLNECATLAGVIQLPERYRPDRRDNLKRSMARRNAVLRAMRENGFLSEAAAANAAQQAVPSKPYQERASSGPYFIEMVRRYVADRYGDDRLYNGGLTIHTTLDRSGQAVAEQAASKAVLDLQRRLNGIFLDSNKVYRRYRISRDRFLANFDSLYALHQDEYGRLPDSMRLRQAQIAVVALDAATSGIRVLIGGRNFEESKFNRVTMALRQPGSAFKPFVYTAALEHGYMPVSVILDQPITLQTPAGEWRPENYDHVFGGPTTIRRAIALSNNTVAIQVLMKVGPAVVVDCARRMGLTHDIQPVPSLAIGSCEATPMEMARAYQVFADSGVAVAPYFIEKITDRTGRTLEQHAPQTRVVLSPRTAWLMCSLLKTVVCCGTASAISRLGFARPAGGKTGTTNDYSDAWFIGFTPQVVCCVWTGTDEHRSLGLGVSGAIAAVPVWVPVMTALHEGLPVRDFTMPDGIKTEKICTESHLIANRWCPSPNPDYFLKETVIDTCTVHGPGRAASRPRDGRDLFGSTSKGGGKQDAVKKRKFLF